MDLTVRATDTFQSPPIRKRLLQVLSYLLFGAALLFLSAGSLAWPMAWAYLGAFVIAIVVASSFVLRKNPDVIAARAEMQKGARRWDAWLTGWIILLGSPGVLIVSGLDRRFGWTEAVPLWGQLAALVAAISGYVVVSWAMAVNRHFEGLVRIQEDRSHRVVSDGPYRFVRHPGYVGMLMMFLALPFVFDSLWALVPAGLAAVLMVVRTALEDRTLRRELEGYEGYAGRVHSRLLPGIW